MPSAPLLVPELAGEATEAAELRSAALAAAGELPEHWVAFGAGPDAVFGPEQAGSFGGFGAEVAVQLAPGVQPRAELPLCALIAGWLRGRVRPDAEVVVHSCADPQTALETGRRVRASIERAAHRTGVLVIADGANTLTASAPGGHRPADAQCQRTLDDALAGGQVAHLAALPPQILGRAGFAALAGLTGVAPRDVTQLYRDAPYGVGYFVGVWRL